jgi:hypothetical protein
MAIKDPTNNVKTAVNLITVSAYDSLIKDLNHLKLDHDSYQAVLDLIEQKKEENMLKVKGKKHKTRVGQTVPAEKQCKNESNGKRCGSFMSDKNVGLCWVHMSEKQKKRHQAEKKNKANLD